jgi:hypothetical protein
MIDIRFLESMSKIRKRTPDIARAKSLVSSCEAIMKEIVKFTVTDDNATIVFRETYESIRQLGDARWWLMGYEPRDHEASMRILMEEKIRNSAKLQKADRFRDIRNNSNYSGYRISKSVADEIIEFWNECGLEILGNLKKEIGR